MSESHGLACWIELFFYPANACCENGVVGWIFNDIWFHCSLPICDGVLPILWKFLEGLEKYLPFWIR